jgi:hypothetical protein
MQSNDWEKRLAAEINRTGERTATAVSNGTRNEDFRKKLAREFLKQISGFLKESIEKFNGLSKNKIELVSISKDDRGDQYCGVGFQSRQIRFTDTGRGFIRIDRIHSETVEEAAFVLARLSRSGEFITWDEKNLLGVGNRLEPVTLKHLVRKYVTMLVTS